MTKDWSAYTNIAIDNTSGIIQFNAGSSIYGLSATQKKEAAKVVVKKAARSTEKDVSLSLINGGDIDISDLIDFSKDNISLKEGDPHLNINGIFLNANVILTNNNSKNLTLYFNNDSNFADDKNFLFTNMCFVPDNKDGNTVIESLHSTIQVPDPIVLTMNDETTTNSYNIPVENIVTLMSFKPDNVLKLFIPEVALDNLDKDNLPLVIKYNNSITLYDILNNIPNYISSYVNTSKYGIDLFAFNLQNNVVDYDNITEVIPPNIQFVVNKDQENKDLLLKSSKSILRIGSEYNSYPGVLSFSDNIKTLILDSRIPMPCEIIIKANNGMEIITYGNINLIFNNTKELELLKLSNNNTQSLGNRSFVSIKQQNNDKLVLKLHDYNVNNVNVNIQNPVSINFCTEIKKTSNIAVNPDGRKLK